MSERVSVHTLPECARWVACDATEVRVSAGTGRSRRVGCTRRGRFAVERAGTSAEFCCSAHVEEAIAGRTVRVSRRRDHTTGTAVSGR